MNAHTAQRPSCPKEIRVLTFTTSGMKMAVDADQIVRLTGLEEAEGRGWKLSTLPDRLARRGGGPLNLDTKVLMAGSESSPIALAIDRLDDILSLQIDDLQPLPRLITSCSASRAVWGAVVRNGEIILLVDLHKLPQA